VENAEIVMTNLNGLPRSWDFFIQGICARKKLSKFSRLWEECSQEEARIENREENMGSEDQALTVHSKKRRRSSQHSRGKNFHQKDNTRKYLSKLRCYTCDERGHFAKDCPRNKINSHKKKGNKRRHHAHAAEDDEPSTQRIRQESDDSSSDEEYVLISALTKTISHGSNDWLIDSGASKNMLRFKESFVKLFENDSPHKVKLGDDYQYPIKGSGESSYKLDSGKSMKMQYVLFVPGLKKNLLSIYALDAKGMRVAFVDGQVLMWPKGKTSDDAVVIGEQ